MPHIAVHPVIDPRVCHLCVLPYDRHPHGCPNFRKALRCPPCAPPFGAVFDPSGPFFAIYSTFDLGKHVAAMRTKHPDWSEAQLRCVLYWQGTARKKLRLEIAAFLIGHSGFSVETTPEALGCNVFVTMAAVGVPLPWPITDTVYHVALAGIVMAERSMIDTTPPRRDEPEESPTDSQQPQPSAGFNWWPNGPLKRLGGTWPGESNT